MLFGLYHPKTQQLLTLDAYPAGECQFLAHETLSYAEAVMVAGLQDDAPPLILKSELQATTLIQDGHLVTPEQHCSLIALSPDLDRSDLEIVVMQNWVRRVRCTAPLSVR